MFIVQANGYQLHKDFTLVTYLRSKISWLIYSMNGPAYFTRAVSYECKKFMKPTTWMFVHESFFPASLIFKSKAGAYLSGAPLMC